MGAGGEQRSHHPRLGSPLEDSCRVSPASPLPSEDGCVALASIPHPVSW